MSALIFETAINIFDYIMLTILLNHFMDKKRVNAWIYNILIVLLALSMGIINVVFYNSTVNFIFSMLILLILSSMYRQSIKLSLLIVGGFAILNLCSELIGLAFIIVVKNEYNLMDNLYSASYMQGIIVMKLMLSILVLLLTRLVKVKKQILPQFFGVILFSVPMISVGIVMTLLDSFFVSGEDILYRRMLGLLFLLYINVIVFVIFDKCNEMALEIMEKKLLEQEVKYKEAYYESLEESQRKLRELKHNFRNLILGIRNILLESDNPEARRVLAEIGELGTVSNIYTENPTVNSILDGKIKEAEEHQIEVNVSVRLPKALNINAGDIGIVLGNLLDNAIEANCELEKGRKIDIQIEYKDKCLLFSIKNPVPVKWKKHLNYHTSSKSDKKEHGIGLKSVKGILKKYEGDISIECEEEFIVNGMFLNV